MSDNEIERFMDALERRTARQDRYEFIARMERKLHRKERMNRL